MVTNRKSSAKPLVSVIIVNWNGGQVFKECLSSLSKIDYPIVANDSSNASIAFFVGRLADAYERGRGKVGSIGDVEISPEA